MEEFQLTTLTYTFRDILLYGRRADGTAARLRVTDFWPYFYVDAPSDCSLDRGALAPSECAWMIQRLERVERTPAYYVSAPRHMLRVVCGRPSNVRVLRDALTSGAQTYEANLEYVLRFMIDTGLTPFMWLRVPRGAAERCRVADLETVPSNARIAPHLLILSFDIECISERGLFPDAQKPQDAVIQISNILQRGLQDPQPRRILLTVDTCAPIDGVEVRSYATERELLLAWHDFVQDEDPDILAGHNIAGFDLPYLLKRAETLRIPEDRFAVLGRIEDRPSEARHVVRRNKQTGTMDTYDVTLPGRIIFDTLPVARQCWRMRS